MTRTSPGRNGTRSGRPSRPLNSPWPRKPDGQVNAVGVILYEALTGVLPFAGRSAAEIVRRTSRIPWFRRDSER